jgi:hypothetical protein
LGTDGSAPPPLNDRTLSGKQIIGVIAGIVFLLFLIGRCGSDDNTKSEDSGSRSATSTSTSPRSPSATAAPTPTGPEKPDATFTTAPGPEGEEVTAAFSIHDNLTEGLIKDGRGSTPSTSSNTPKRRTPTLPR